MCGTNVVGIYASKIFDKIAETGSPSPLSSDQQSYLIGVSNLVGSILAHFTIHHFTRRQLFIGGYVVLGIELALVVIAISKSNSMLCLIALSIFPATFQCTQGSAFWIYPTEVLQDAAIGIV